MKLRSFALVAAVALVTVGCGYVRGHVEVIGPPQPGFYFSVTVNAASGPLGTAEKYAPGLNSFSGPVTCLAVAGNRATIGVENTLDPEAIAGGLIWVEDNGSPGAGVDVVNVAHTSEVPATCEPPTDADLDFAPQFPGIETIYSGDIVVGVLGVTATARS